MTHLRNAWYVAGFDDELRPGDTAGGIGAREPGLRAGLEIVEKTIAAADLRSCR